MAHNGNSAHHLAYKPHFAGEVAGVAHHKLGFSCHAFTGHSACHTRLVVHHLSIWLVEHIGPPIDCAQACKGLWQLPQTIARVQVGRGEAIISEQRLVVQLDLQYGRDSRLRQIGVIPVKCNGVPDKVCGIFIQVVLLEQLRHGHPVEVIALVGACICRVVFLDVLEKASGTPFLKQTHQGRLESLHVRGWHLVDFAFAEHKAAIHCLELQVLDHTSVKQHTHQLSVSHHEFGH
mmetsp:Transcript_9564/g.16905  ORF Transcript_9564/g.16905 Transcript_9564/m.16905 type:complete len:234 (-) Transcript_9564:278-979(-)